MDTRTEKSIGQTTADVTDVGHERSRRLAEVARETGNRVAGAWNQARDTIQERTRAGVEVTDRTVREHPYASIGVAFCTGLLLGVLLARGRD